MAIERHWRYRALYWDFANEKWAWLLKKTIKPNYCATRGCPDPVNLEWRRTQKRGPFLFAPLHCNKCKSRRWRANHPVPHLYRELKQSANRRKIPFDITYGEFLDFCIEHNFYNRSERFDATTLTFDRENPKLGYSISNIRLITNARNVARENKWRAYKAARAGEETPYPDYVQGEDEPF